MPVQVKSCWEAYRKRNDKCRNIWTDGTQGCINNLLLKNKIVRYKVDKNVEQGISAATGCITERLIGHHSPERKIERF